MKTVQDLPVGKFASQQGLSIMRADTSQEITQLSEQYLFNLVIAVSYGRLIPSTFIQHCKYGGLNVHRHFYRNIVARHHCSMPY